MEKKVEKSFGNQAYNSQNFCIGTFVTAGSITSIASPVVLIIWLEANGHRGLATIVAVGFISVISGAFYALLRSWD